MPRYPLANDAEGNPIDVPPTVTSWRVRRQPSRQGRPKAIQNGNGDPLTVPLDATFEDLRALGCEPDRYRFDGLDAKGAIVDPPVVAFAEILATAADRQATLITGTDPAVYRMADALARVVESGHRSDAQMARFAEYQNQTLREIVTAIVQARAPVPRNASLRDQIAEALEIQETLRNSDGAPPAAPSDSENAANGIVKGIVEIMNGLPALVAMWKGQPVPTGANGATAIPAALVPLLQQLTPDEQQTALRMVSALDPATIQRLSDLLGQAPLAVALAKVREMIAQHLRDEAKAVQNRVASILNQETATHGK
jgi:hypothetical protein